MSKTTSSCTKCNQPAYSDPAPHERLVRDNATGRIYCAFCADELARVAWGQPATITHQDGRSFSFKKS